MSSRLAQTIHQSGTVPRCLLPHDSILKHFYLLPQARVRMGGEKRFGGSRVRTAMAGIQPSKQGVIGGPGVAGMAGVEQLFEKAGLTSLMQDVPALPGS